MTPPIVRSLSFLALALLTLPACVPQAKAAKASASSMPPAGEAGINFSVSAAMGFVSIFGIAIQDAILMVTYSQRQWREGKSVEDGARAAAEQRFRPVLMTTLVAMLGLLPAALSQGIGAQTQKPLAVVVIGGCFVLAGLTRIIQPPLLVLAHRWHARRAAARAARAAVPEAV
jgi:Cu/Ag efflux pump CusA